MCGITHMADLLEIVVSEFTHGLEHELADASDPRRALPSFAALSIVLLLRHQTSHASLIVPHGTLGSGHKAKGSWMPDAATFAKRVGTC